MYKTNQQKKKTSYRNNFVNNFIIQIKLCTINGKLNLFILFHFICFFLFRSFPYRFDKERKILMDIRVFRILFTRRNESAQYSLCPFTSEWHLHTISPLKALSLRKTIKITRNYNNKCNAFIFLIFSCFTAQKVVDSITLRNG